MARVSDVFPSNYLKAGDLQGRTLRVTMDRVEVEQIGQDRKPVLYFRNKQKGVVLNKTNATNIALMFGEDMDDWGGSDVELFPTMVDYQGRSVEAIRIRPVRPQKQAAPAQATSARAADDLNDDVPF
jgi:hypothetical protein